MALIISLSYVLNNANKKNGEDTKIAVELNGSELIIDINSDIKIKKHETKIDIFLPKNIGNVLYFETTSPFISGIQHRIETLANDNTYGAQKNSKFFILISINIYPIENNKKPTKEFDKSPSIGLALNKYGSSLYRFDQIQ